jgi:hypothetical protein
MLPAIIWNAQHAWITLTHLRSRGSLDQSFGFIHVIARISRGPLFFFFFTTTFSRTGLGGDRELEARASAIQSSLSFLVRTAGLWLLLPSLDNKQAAPNWDALAFVSWECSRPIICTNVSPRMMD